MNIRSYTTKNKPQKTKPLGTPMKVPIILQTAQMQKNQNGAPSINPNHKNDRINKVLRIIA